jgi:Domain of unknown function (DUF3597)
MGIFDRIKNAIWGSSKAEPEPTTIDTKTKPVVASASDTPAATPKMPKTSDSKPSGTAVDVAAILDAAVKKKRQKLKWRTSIVDLMKALDLDSSLSARKELAKELGYDGDMKSSAKMNVWLHKQVIQKLKDNGGKVPDEFR